MTSSTKSTKPGPFERDSCFFVALVSFAVFIFVSSGYLILSELLHSALSDNGMKVNEGKMVDSIIKIINGDEQKSEELNLR